ncbi:helix-turn-helix transcriptional regulator [Agrobacterium rhizogenes]|uniref:helix-turn-helix domain-containing protein n=1 Tax=Rhizobium rhizogenes TaxID=359 RepID=UPI001574288F|nr:AraC family transcriptional regulator [Rhizobium rhizogenes]NTG35207.1 helix-turn-helix transcriptional regulator [Rhizobium rhizogenes]NTG54456.1 helix-turn-helix transcriptional regulator [Rhizobium rhizogenes]NTH00118.1 helix-turn-helix transcriptional regulator [Rhizobium rhizogenes]NTH64834.1 helix-turn-helix transcriptional regulator [Rhizobium rhizogenes]NTI02922.1 helix-turn-helix transcriptional regulator [Rhizobium rhizogenes]
MRPYLEVLQRSPETSWSMLNRRLDDAIPFQWHHHPEFELTLTLNSIGQRFIGDHSSDYDDGDLVLVGPNLPHTWASRAKINEHQPHVALVLWFHRDWLLRMTGGTVEFRQIEAMLERADGGLHYSKETAQAVRLEYEAVFDKPPVERLLSLLNILARVAEDRQATPLASAPGRSPDIKESRERIDRVLTHMHLHYARAISLEELADIAALSVSGLHRMFRRHTGTAISDYLTRMRIGDACARLSSTTQAIHHISDAVGYHSIANFNRQFKTLKSMTPRQYRTLFVRR